MAEKFQPNPHLRRLANIMYPKDAEQPILAPAVREAVHQWMTELWAADDLRAVKVEPRRSAILAGPPGCGKTTLAHHFSARLGMPLICVQMDALVGSHVGETGRNIASLFESIEGQEDRCVLFMDEFDAVATKRTEDNQAAAREMNAAVNALLQRIEVFGGTTIAATNRAEAIDPAMWRRFGLHLDIALPGDDERYAILTRYLEPYRLSEQSMDVLCEATSGAPPRPSAAVDGGYQARFGPLSATQPDGRCQGGVRPPAGVGEAPSRLRQARHVGRPRDPRPGDEHPVAAGHGPAGGRVMRRRPAILRTLTPRGWQVLAALALMVAVTCLEVSR